MNEREFLIKQIETEFSDGNWPNRIAGISKDIADFILSREAKLKEEINSLQNKCVDATETVCELQSKIERAIEVSKNGYGSTATKVLQILSE